VFALPGRDRQTRGMSTAPRVDVSIVLPVYNEAGHLADEVKRIRAGMDGSPYRYEIIVIDDGSTDGSAAELTSVEGIRLVTFEQNRGSGAARRAGTAPGPRRPSPAARPARRPRAPDPDILAKRHGRPATRRASMKKMLHRVKSCGIVRRNNPVEAHR